MMSEDTEDEYTVMKDFMVKRSLMRSSIFQYANFKARWFSLTNYSIKYHEGNMTKGIGREINKIPLSCVKVVEEADLTVIDDSRQHGFQVWYEDTTVTPRKNLKLYISASSEDMKHKWIAEIRKGSSMQRADMLTKHHPGVWTPKRSEFTCCGQQSKDAPGCSACTTSARNNHSAITTTLTRPLQPPKQKAGGKSSSNTSPNATRKTNSPLPDKKKPASPKLIRKHSPNPHSHFQSHSPPAPEVRVTRVLDLSLPQEPKVVNNLVDLHVQEPSNLAPASPLASPLLQKKYVIVSFDYTSDNPDDLNIIKGEKLEIIDDTAEQYWWQARNSEGRIGFVPFNYVTEIKSTSVESYPWFFPNMNRPQAELLLKEDGREGVYLVRKSGQSNCYTVGIFTKEGRADTGTVRHYHIKNNDEGNFYLSDVHPQPSIPEVIGYHAQNAGGLITRLRFYPHEMPAPPTVGLAHGKFKIDRSELQMERQLGKGNFGEVWKAKYRGKTDVAVKMTLPNLVDDFEFINEAKLMMQLQNEHLVQLYGVCEKPDLLIVTEYMEEGALLDYLKKSKSRLISQPKSCLEIARQVCHGMAYLESMKFIHRDLAARNCLVGSSEYGYIVKVADFGLSRCVVDDEYTCSIGAKFPIRWSSPEVLLYTRFSSKSDVWAFGVLMWEVFTCGDTPYHNYPRNQDVVEYVSKKKRFLPCPRHCPNNIYTNIMVKCWQYKEESRPKFSDLVELLGLNWA